MTKLQLRNLLPPVYGLVCVIGLLVGAIGVFALVGALVFAIAWTALSADARNSGVSRSERRAARRA